MKKNIMYGVIDHSGLGRPDDHLFRITLKAFIQDAEGNVLVVKEKSRTCWDLPGGGMNHDESFYNALKRELKEEVELEGDFIYDILAVEPPHELKTAQVMQVRLIFKVAPENMTFSSGLDADEVTYIDPATLEDSEHLLERKIFEYSLKK